MDALLILNRRGAKDVSILVKITEKKLKERLIFLLEDNRGKEAFDFLVLNAEVQDYFPFGKPIPKRPMLITLDEELLKSQRPAKK